MVAWLVQTIFLHPKLDTVSLWTAKIEQAMFSTLFPDSGQGPDENWMEIQYRPISEKPGKITFSIPPEKTYPWQKRRPGYHQLLFRLGWDSIIDAELEKVTLNRTMFFCPFPHFQLKS